MRDESESLSDAELSLKRLDDIGAATDDANGWLEEVFARPAVAPVIELKFEDSKRIYLIIIINFSFFYNKPRFVNELADGCLVLVPNCVCTFSSLFWISSFFWAFWALARLRFSVVAKIRKDEIIFLYLFGIVLELIKAKKKELS